MLRSHLVAELDHVAIADIVRAAIRAASWWKDSVMQRFKYRTTVFTLVIFVFYGRTSSFFCATGHEFSEDRLQLLLRWLVPAETQRSQILDQQTE